MSRRLIDISGSHRDIISNCKVPNKIFDQFQDDLVDEEQLRAIAREAKKFNFFLCLWEIRSFHLIPLYDTQSLLPCWTTSSVFRLINLKAYEARFQWLIQTSVKIVCVFLENYKTSLHNFWTSLFDVPLILFQLKFIEVCTTSDWTASWSWPVNLIFHPVYYYSSNNQKEPKTAKYCYIWWYILMLFSLLKDCRLQSFD